MYPPDPWQEISPEGLCNLSNVKLLQTRVGKFKVACVTQSVKESVTRRVTLSTSLVFNPSLSLSVRKVVE